MPLPARFTAPPNRPPAGGLVALSVSMPDPPRGWEQGFSFDGEPCDPGLLYAQVCQVVTEKAVVAPADRPDITDYLPVMIVAADECSTLGRTQEEVEARARRLLVNVESYQLEVAFWTGEATDDPTVNGGDRPHLADGTATVLAAGAATDVVRAVALLDQALSDCLHGAAGMVHLSPFAAAMAAAGDVLLRENGRWYTPAGHTVVAGSGYEGVGPRPNPGDALPAAPALGGDQWAYGTPTVTTLRGEIDVLSTIDRSVNDATTRVERPAAAFHGPCCKFAIQLDFTPAP